MREKILCDNCKREFDGAEEIVDSLNRVICPDCNEDLNVEFI